jgi:hypothetical protein
VQSAAIDSPFSEELFCSDVVEGLPDAADEAVVALDTAGNQGRRVHSEVDIGDGRLRVVQDEAERPSAGGVAATEIGANERRRRAVLLRVPGRAVAAKVSCVKIAGFAFLKIGREGGKRRRISSSARRVSRRCRRLSSLGFPW